MRTLLLRLIATIAIVASAACSSLGQTALPATQAPPQAPAPAASAPASDDASDTADDAPVSKDETPGTAPSSSSSDSKQSLPKPSHAADRPLVRYVCRHPAQPGERACDAIVHRYAGGAPACRKSVPYCASDLQAAYGLAQIAKTGGKGAIVAIVGAYGDPDAASDLSVYRRAMGLPACSPGNGCLKIVNQNGTSSPLPRPNADPDNDWRAEEALGLEMLSAICPNCRLVLVEANSAKSADLAAGVNAAAALGALAVANPYSSKEGNATDGAYAHAGRAIVASAGDEGTGARQPCSYAGVVCVGGTALSYGGRSWIERAWASTGSGCSAYVAKPSWQHVKGCAGRSEADVAAVADPNTGVAFYESAGGGWQQAGGTSVATAIVAAAFALGPQAALANAPQWIWRHGGTAAYRDVVGGSNGTCSVFYLCHAREGYDGPTGWGTPQRITGL
ncbi:MAG: hypothetical protein WA814_02325 [Candidatus Baltobacteraceae bacterium]